QVVGVVVVLVRGDKEPGSPGDERAYGVPHLVGGVGTVLEPDPHDLTGATGEGGPRGGLLRAAVLLLLLRGPAHPAGAGRVPSVADRHEHQAVVGALVVQPRHKAGESERLVVRVG